jgi:lysophospholipase L1-like esterase
MLFNYFAYVSISPGLIWIFILVAVVLIISFLKDGRPKTKKVIFFGDSLTQFGLDRDGYITVMKKMLKQQGITDYDLFGAGISGNKVPDLYERLIRDVITQSPHIVVIWIGVNDVWHKYAYGTGTEAITFEKTYRDIVKQLLEDKIKLLLVTPAVIGERADHTNHADDDLDRYTAIVKNIANDNELAVCNMRTLFQQYEIHNNTFNVSSGILTTDGVHLSTAGNKFVAEELWKVLKDV